MDDLLEATYQKYRAELKAGRDISDEAKRLQMRKDIENDPDLEVDRNAPKDIITDQEMEKRYPELAKWKDEIQMKRYARRNAVQGPAELHRGFVGRFEDAVAHLYIWRAATTWRPAPRCSREFPLVLDNPKQPLEFPDPPSIRNGTAPTAG